MCSSTLDEKKEEAAKLIDDTAEKAKAFLMVSHAKAKGLLAEVIAGFMIWREDRQEAKRQAAEEDAAQDDDK